MRSKKLLRQLKKSLDCENIESELNSIRKWLGPQERGTPPEPLQKLVGNLPLFFDAVESAYEQSESFYNQAQRSLVISGQEIEERNKLLRTENQKVNNLLDNMRQAVFSVLEKGNIVGPVSKYSVIVFGKDIIDKNVFDVLYSGIENDSEEYSGLQTALTVVFGESDLQWELSEDSFPKRVILRGENNDVNVSPEKYEKILKVACSPIWNDKNVLEKIMFIVEDVTEVEKLERRIVQEKAQSSRALQIVHELISVKREDVIEFITRAQKTLFFVKKSFDRADLSSNYISETLQVLHSIKGNARLLGFNFISSTVHKSESLVLEIKEQIDKFPELWAEMRKVSINPFEQVIYVVDEYYNVIIKLFGTDFHASESKENRIEISVHKIEELKQCVVQLAKNSGPELIQEVQYKLEHLSDVSICKEFENYSRVIRQIASDLAKDVDFNIVSDDCFYSREKLPLLKDAIVHLLRNAIDHGIESTGIRKSLGKSKTGLLKLIIKKTENRFLIWVSDDGAGIDVQLIANKVLAKNLKLASELESMSKEQVIDLIFLPHFSTRDEVTELSGRGIGMDVVKTNIAKLGGSIKVETKLGKGTLFKITIPL
jgi:chemotaxis protein histidine kinase CheA